MSGLRRPYETRWGGRPFGGGRSWSRPGGGMANDPFTPSKIGWVSGAWAWREVRDLSTLFSDRSATPATPASVDGVVGTILDKSGNGLHAIAPSDSARGILRTSGGKYWIETDGSDDTYSWISGANIFRNRARGVICAAGSFLSPGVGMVISAISTGASAAGQRAAIGVNTAHTRISASGRRLDADSNLSAFLDASDFNVASAWRAAYDWANSDLFLYRNGALVGSNTSFQTDGSTSDTASQGCFIASNGGSGSFLNGRFYGDVIGVPNSITTDMDKLDAYMASLV